MKNDLLAAISIITFVFVFFMVISIMENPKSNVVQNNEIIQNETTESFNILSKDKCYDLEKSLWNNNRQSFTDNSKYINETYDYYNKNCSSYLAQAAKWKPDKYWFLFNNYYFLAKDYYIQKDYEKASFYYTKAIEECKKSLSPKTRIDIAYYEGGLSYYYIEDYEKAKEYLLKAPQKFLLALESLANIYFDEGNYSISATYYEKCLNIVSKDLEKYSNDDYIQPMNEDKFTYLYQKQLFYQDRLTALQEILSIRSGY